jgi:peptidyl-tRNA hydrolase, PTH1 family
VKLVVGLGNPGIRYGRTRHNIGFRVVDRLAARYRIEVDKRRCSALVGEGVGEGEKIVLAKPQTLMNRSGMAVKALLDEYHGRAEDLVVVYDDLDLPLGRLRIRVQGSAAGHRGMLSILENLSTAAFVRVRIGIGRPPEGMEGADYVLSPFEAEEAPEVERVLERAVEAVDCLVREGPRRAMELYNRVS